MRIYHYTNIETLALILKNRTIRFNRLDKVDDLEECNFSSYGIKLSQYVFVSCWTKSDEESISLWKLYGGNKNGIRISLDYKMFNEYPLINPILGNVQWVGGMFSKIPYNDLNNPTFFFLPVMNYEKEIFFRDIQYVENISKYINESLIKKEGEGLSIAWLPIGTYKHKRWEFQQESRFVLYCMPKNPLFEVQNKEIGFIMIKSLLDNIQLPFEYYDLSLKNNAFDNLEITMNPEAMESQKIIIESMVEKYAPQAKIYESKLKNKIRLK